MLEGDLERAVGTLHHKARAVEVQLCDSGLQRLARADAFQFFRRLINYDAATLAASTLTYEHRTWTTSSRTPQSSATVIA